MFKIIRKSKIVGLAVFGVLGLVGGFYVINRQNSSSAEGGAYNDVIINVKTKHEMVLGSEDKNSKDYQFSIRMDEANPYKFENTEENKRIVLNSLSAKAYKPKFSPSAVLVGEREILPSDIMISDKAILIDVVSIANRMKTDIGTGAEIQILAKENYDFSKLSVKIKEGASLNALTEPYKWSHRIGAFQRGRVSSSYLPRIAKITAYDLSGIKFENSDFCVGKAVDLKKIFADNIEATWVEEISITEIGEKTGKVHLKYNNGLAVSGDVALTVNVVECPDENKKDDDINNTDDKPKDDPKANDDSEDDPKDTPDTNDDPKDNPNTDDNSKENPKTDDPKDASKNSITPTEAKEESPAKISAPDTGFGGYGNIFGAIGIILLAITTAAIYRFRK